MYEVIDRQTQKNVGTYTTLKAASRSADRKDLQYGAIRYMVRPVNNITKP